MNPIVADLVLANIGELITCDPALGDGPLGIIANAALAAADGRVVWVGRESELAERVTADPTRPRQDGIDARSTDKVGGFLHVNGSCGDSVS